jgi:hypothetical protein
MKYTVRPVTKEGCDCDNCRAGKHLYSLFRWKDGQWRWVAMSLQSYASAQECKRQHYWGVQFKPGDTWEGGSPVEEPEEVRLQAAQAEPGEMVPLDQEALTKSLDALKRHVLPRDAGTD